MIEQLTERREVVRRELARDLSLALLALADELTSLAERVDSLDSASLATVSEFAGQSRYDLDCRLDRL